MITPEKLLKRLDEIGESLAASGHGLALLGLGSVGVERGRLDEYSDLDYFAIVAEGQKEHFLDDTSWMSAMSPITYMFRNTTDGYKYLYEDGIFCEMAVFTPGEIVNADYAEGKIIWHAPGFDMAIAKPNKALPTRHDRNKDWVIGEALTNLYVGMGRYLRGEKLIAFRFVQSYALDRVLDLIPRLMQAKRAFVDPYQIERRFEQQYPEAADILARCAQGYDRTPESAREILRFLECHFGINQAIKHEIEQLIERAKS